MTRFSPLLALPLALALAACGGREPPSCHGETFALNPTRVGFLAVAPVASPAGSPGR